MELSSALRRVRALIERAEHPETPVAEAEACRAKADEIMEKYAIQEWQTAQATQTGLKPDKMKIDLGEADSPWLAETAMLLSIVANYCRCQSVWMSGSGYVGYRQEYAYVYGYPSDLRYVELLFTTVYLHMAGAIFGRPDPALTEGENIREFRNGGFNWNDIAGAFGWQIVSRNGSKTVYRNRSTGEEKLWGAVVGRIKRLYAAEIKARGEEPFSLGRGGARNKAFRANSVNGYIVRIKQRLDEQAGRRGAGTELVLRDRSQNITAMVEEAHPDMATHRQKRTEFIPEAYRRGVNHANTASLQPEAGAAPKTALS